MKTKKARLQVIEEGVVHVGALRGQRCANGARWGRIPKQEIIINTMLYYSTRLSALKRENTAMVGAMLFIACH